MATARREGAAQVVTLRVRKEELEAWKDAAAKEGKSLSGWVRDRCRYGEIKGVRQGKERGKSDKSEIVREMVRIGNNINQVARWVNTYKSSADAGKVILLLGSICLEMEKLSKSK